MMGRGASGGGMSASPSVEWMFTNSTTGKVSPCRVESQSSIFASQLPCLVMSMISGALSLDLVFLDFEDRFGEPVAFEPWVLLFGPVGGITMVGTSQLNMG